MLSQDYLKLPQGAVIAPGSTFSAAECQKIHALKLTTFTVFINWSNAMKRTIVSQLQPGAQVKLTPQGIVYEVTRHYDTVLPPYTTNVRKFTETDLHPVKADKHGKRKLKRIDSNTSVYSLA